MDLYAEDLVDYIYQENDVNKKTDIAAGSGSGNQEAHGRTGKGGALI